VTWSTADVVAVKSGSDPVKGDQVGTCGRDRIETTGEADSAANLEIEQKVTGRGGDVASQSQSPRQSLGEELATVDLQGRGDDEP
jgi:hypothetical protein